MHKIRYTTILLLVVFCIIPIVSILMLNHLTLMEALNKMGSGNLGDAVEILKIEKHENADDIIGAVKSLKSSIAIYTDIEQEYGTIRYIYFNKSYINLPMKKGRFFKATDFKKDNYVCVIGKDRVNETYNKDNKQFININGKDYQVIGVLGYEKETIYDSYVFINMSTVDLKDARVFIFDYLEKIDPDIISAEIKKYYVDNGLIINELAKAAEFSEMVMPKIVTARWFILLLTACFLCLILISIRWIEQQKRDLVINRIVGATKIDIGLTIFLKYFLIFLMSVIVGLIYCYVIYPAYGIQLVKGYLISDLFIAGFLLWSIYYILRAPIEEVIKQ